MKELGDGVTKVRLGKGSRTRGRAHHVQDQQGGKAVIRVLICDDQEVIRTGLRLFLESAHDISVVGGAADGAQAVTMARALVPDVVLMDVRMPHVDGIEATRALAGAGVIDPIPVIVVTSFDDDEHLFGALDAGASGFLLKDTDPRTLVDAVRAAARGDALVSPVVTPRVIAEFARRRPSRMVSPRTREIASAGLTVRELEVIRALARGLSNAEIADRLYLVPGTVKVHLTRIYAKIGTRDRLQTAVWAFDHGITEREEVGPREAAPRLR